MQRAAVPEATVNENRKTLSGEYDIGLPKQAIVNPIPATKGPKHFSYDDLRSGISPPDAGHASAALFRRQHVNHESTGCINNISSRGPVHFLVKTLLKYVGNNVSKLVGQERGDGVAHLAELVAPVALEKIVVRESLEPSRFPNSEAPALALIGMDEVMAVLGQMRRDCGGRIIPELYPKPVGECVYTPLLIWDRVGMVGPQRLREFMHLGRAPVSGRKTGGIEIPVQIGLHVRPCFMLNSPSHTRIPKPARQCLGWQTTAHTTPATIEIGGHAAERSINYIPQCWPAAGLHVMVSPHD